MSINITNLYYTEDNIGLNLHISKKQYVWGFELDGVPQHIKLLDSRISHKKRLYKNGEQIFYIKQKANFSHNFEIDGHPCVIIQYGDKIELRIDNESFAHLYNLQKNRELLKGDNGPTSKISINKNYNTISYDQEKYEKNNSVFYTNNTIKKENPKLFNFKIKKETGNKSLKINKKFYFGEMKKKINEPSLTYSNENRQNNINANNNNKNFDLLNLENKTESPYKTNPVNFSNDNNIQYNNINNNNYQLNEVNSVNNMK